MYPPNEAQERVAILRRTWKLCERNFDEDVIEGALAGTSALELPQLRGCCEWVVKHDPKGPLLRGILDAVDAATRSAQRKVSADREGWSLPTINIDSTRRKEQLAILQRFKKPASTAWWNETELFAIREELEADSPALAVYNQRVAADLEYWGKTGRMMARRK